MKKKSLINKGFILLINIVIIFLCSCTKNQEIVTNKNKDSITKIRLNIVNQNGIINFKTKETYEDALLVLNNMTNSELDEFEQSLNFKSLRKYYIDNKLDTLPYYDKIFFTILNQENEIIINGNYFKLNFEHGNLIVKKIKDNDLKSYSNADSFIFSLEEDVLEIIENTTDLKSYLDDEFCNSYSTNWITMNKLVNGITHYKMGYIKYGIYFTLKAKIEETDGITWMVVFTKPGELIYQPNYENTWKNADQIRKDGTESAEIVPYSRAKRLLSYNWTCNFGSSSFYVSGSSWVSNNDYYQEVCNIKCH